MTSKEKILSAVREVVGKIQPLPSGIEGVMREDRLDRYKASLTKAGGTWFTAPQSDWNSTISSQFPEVVSILSLDSRIKGTLDATSIKEPHALKPVEVCVLPCGLAVAENAAHWVGDQVLPHRVLPFICQHLVLFLNVNSIVPTMHEAYPQIDLKACGFGVFIAGPSKTADIEQSLVIGAHGPRSLTVYLVGE